MCGSVDNLLSQCVHLLSFPDQEISYQKSIFNLFVLYKEDYQEVMQVLRAVSYRGQRRLTSVGSKFEFLQYFFSLRNKISYLGIRLVFINKRNKSWQKTKKNPLKYNMFLTVLLSETIPFCQLMHQYLFRTLKELPFSNIYFFMFSYL